MQITQYLKQAVQIHPLRLATIDIKNNRRQTWLEFGTRVTKLAGALQSFGVKTGDRVAILTINSDVHLEYYFATIWTGGISVPLNTRLASNEIWHILDDCGAKFLIVDDSTYPTLHGNLENSSSITHTIFAGAGKSPDGLVAHETFLQSSNPVPGKDCGDEDIAMITYTGGTTGQPKGAMLTHNNIIHNSRSALAILDDDEPWTYLHAAPMYHIADCQWNTGVTMAGGTHVFLDKFDPEDVLTAIDRFKITHTALVPTMIKMLCDLSDIDSFDLSSLRKINFGGSPISPELIKKARQKFPQCEFIQGYGLTETSPNISMLPDKYNRPGNPKIESAGRPVPGMDVMIIDENGDEVPRGIIGEIITKGPHVMAGYWNDSEETERVLRNGWLHTGDLGYMDEDGFIFVVDRLKDMIITGGENVYSTEVEQVIEKLDGVEVCAVIGIPDEKWGEAVYAIVLPKINQKLSEEEIKSHCRQYLAHYKCPKSIEIRYEPLPVSGPGKILKRKLRKPFWPKDGRQVN
ncbi:MAG: long-chain fatty acid--CoA ligase [Balneolaceae bacterium]|nr:long-chain fatty acid--CoA ligase [Balneolaceae bacterium]